MENLFNSQEHFETDEISLALIENGEIKTNRWEPEIKDSTHFHPQVDKIKFTKEDDLTEFHYEENVLFDRPLVIRGTRKQYVPYAGIDKMQELKEDNYQQILTSLQNTEQMDLQYIRSISELDFIEINNEGFLFTVKEEFTDYIEEHSFFVSFEDSTVAFRRLSNILKIPYAFSKHSPGFLNEENFQVWKNLVCEQKRKDVPVGIVYSKVCAREVVYDNKTYLANEVITFLPANTIRKADGGCDLIKKDIASQVPVLHKIIPPLVSAIQKEIPQGKLILHSIATGFTGHNKGDHFVKFLIDSPDMKWNISGDEYMPTIMLRSNFTGDDKKYLGYAQISLSLMKLACSNGMMVEMPEQHLQTVREQFVQRLLEVNQILPTHPKYQKLMLKCQKVFKKQFSNFSCVLSLHELLNQFDKSDFISLLQVFISCIDTVIQESMQELQIPFGNIRDEDFVEVVETLSKKNKFKPDMARSIIVEHLAARRDGVIAFKNSYDIVGYLSYLIQAYNTKMQVSMEQKLILFGKEITAALVYKAQYRQETLLKYQQMLVQ